VHVHEYSSDIALQLRQMCNDPTYYYEPNSFNPDRFLALPEYDPRNLVFGFGRRTCPGKEFASASVFIAMAMIIATFNISKAKDEFGNDVEALTEYTKGHSHPKPFRYSIVPRSENFEALVRNVLHEHPHDRDDSKKIRIVCQWGVFINIKMVELW